MANTFMEFFLNSPFDGLNLDFHDFEPNPCRMCIRLEFKGMTGNLCPSLFYDTSECHADCLFTYIMVHKSLAIPYVAFFEEGDLLWNSIKDTFVFPTTDMYKGFCNQNLNDFIKPIKDIQELFHKESHTYRRYDFLISLMSQFHYNLWTNPPMLPILSGYAYVTPEGIAFFNDLLGDEMDINLSYDRAQLELFYKMVKNERAYPAVYDMPSKYLACYYPPLYRNIALLYLGCLLTNLGLVFYLAFPMLFVSG